VTASTRRRGLLPRRHLQAPRRQRRVGTGPVAGRWICEDNGRACGTGRVARVGKRALTRFQVDATPKLNVGSCLHGGRSAQKNEHDDYCEQPLHDFRARSVASGRAARQRGCTLESIRRARFALPPPGHPARMGSFHQSRCCPASSTQGARLARPRFHSSSKTSRTPRSWTPFSMSPMSSPSISKVILEPSSIEASVRAATSATVCWNSASST
jgi:hypothetical protein